MVVISRRNQNSDRVSYVWKAYKKKQKQNFWQLSKFHVNLGFLLLRNNSDKIKYLTPQSTGLDKIRL